MPSYVTSAQAQAACAETIRVWYISGAFSEAAMLVDLNAVESEVNAALQSRYTVPVTDATATPFIQGMVVALLRAKAYSHLASIETPEVILQEARAARGQLRDISSGRLELPGVSGDGIQKEDAGLPQHLATSYSAAACKRSQLESW